MRKSPERHEGLMSFRGLACDDKVQRVTESREEIQGTRGFSIYKKITGNAEDFLIENIFCLTFAKEHAILIVEKNST